MKRVPVGDEDDGDDGERGGRLQRDAPGSLSHPITPASVPLCENNHFNLLLMQFSAGL